MIGERENCENIKSPVTSRKNQVPRGRKRLMGKLHHIGMNYMATYSVMANQEHSKNKENLLLESSEKPKPWRNSERAVRRVCWYN